MPTCVAGDALSMSRLRLSQCLHLDDFALLFHYQHDLRSKKGFLAEVHVPKILDVTHSEYRHMVFSNSQLFVPMDKCTPTSATHEHRLKATLGRPEWLRSATDIKAHRTSNFTTMLTASSTMLLGSQSKPATSSSVWTLTIAEWRQNRSTPANSSLVCWDTLR